MCGTDVCQCNTNRCPQAPATFIAKSRAPWNCSAHERVSLESEEFFLASSHTHSFLIQVYVHMFICCGTGVFFFCFILQLRRKRSNACRRCSSFVVPRSPVYSFARLFTQPLIVVLAGWLVDRGIEMEIITCSLIQLVTALISCFAVCLCACVCVCLCGCALVRHMCCHSTLVNI